MLKTENTPKIEKKKKSLTVDLYVATQPIRDCVSALVFGVNVAPETLEHVQGELRRLSRLVKRTRASAQ